MKETKHHVNEETPVQALSYVIRQQAFSCFKKYFASEITEKTKESKSIPIYAHWMALVLLASDDMQIILKVHYNDTQAQSFMQRKFKKKDTVFERDQIDSFVCELLNLIGVNIKNDLAKKGIQAGMSLPIATRGFDNFFFQAKENHKNTKDQSVARIYDLWTLSIDDLSFDFSFDCDIVNTNIFEKIILLCEDLKKTENEEESDDLEFL